MTPSKRLLLVLLLLAPACAGAAERIIRFHADIQVHADGAMSVTETIRVRAEGRDIKRGIYRDLPTAYEDAFGRRVRVEYTHIGAQRDGRPEAHHQKALSNGIRIYLGQENRRLDPGEYAYTLSYRSERQLGFFDDHDELYWNVTGNGWRFPIDAASASVRLPAGVPGAEMRLEAYTGPAGARGQDYEAMLDIHSVARFRATRGLAAGEGLTIVVSWPKGHVTEPSARQRTDWFVRDNAPLVAGAAGLAILLIYYMLVWVRVGRDPAPGVIIARYAPPDGYSPASMRFVRRMGYDNKSFSAALVNLAVKGHLRIHGGDGDFSLEKLDGCDAALAPGESALLTKLFSGGGRIALERRNHKRIKSAIRAHSRSLQADYEKRYFNTNVGYTLLGVLMSVLTLVGALMVGPSIEETAGAGFMVVWLSGWTFGVFALGRAVFAAWVRPGIVGRAGAVVITLFAMPFFAGEIAGLVFLAHFAGVALIVILLMLIFVNWMFYELMKAPTRLGRKLLDAVDGFREYLNVAEADELRFKHPPQMTPALFERYLPYALALDVEAVWGGKFSRIIADAQRAGHYRQPDWYSGSLWRANTMGSFASSLGSSLASTVSASSTAPGSSSGSGGGGSSGGGGGGGGGGGW